MGASRLTVNPRTHSVGIDQRVVTVTDIPSGQSTAICVDKTGVEVRVPLYWLRAKGALPQVGESWLVTQEMGQWGFSVFMGTSRSQFPILQTAGGGSQLIQPSGDTSGVTDTANIQAALNSAAVLGFSVQLASGVFSTINPIRHPPGVAWSGSYANEVATYQDALYGTVIQPAAGFSQGSAPGNAVILMLDQVTGGYAKHSEEQKQYGFMIDCHLIPGANVVDGIQIWGDTKRVHLERILVSWPTGNGVSTVTAGGNNPNALRYNRVVVRDASLAGFVLFRDSDGTYIDCMAENCTGDGWDITNLSNGLLLGCRAEHNNIGFNYSNSSEGTGSGGGKFVGCSTDRNQQHGMLITTANATGVPLILSGCAFRRDGRNNDTGAGGFAGLAVSGFPSVVQVSGCTVFPGVNDDGSGVNSPQYGLLLAGGSSATAVLVSGSYIQGAAQALSDDGTCNAEYDNATLLASGTTGTPVFQEITVSAVSTQQNFAAERVMTTYTIPARDPLAGSDYEFWGAALAADTGTPTLRIRVRIGALTGPVIGDTGVITCRTASGMAFAWRGRLRFTAVGPTGATIDAMCDVTEHLASGTGAIHSAASVGVAPGDTTQPVKVVMTAQWSVADPANSIQTTSASMERSRD